MSKPIPTVDRYMTTTPVTISVGDTLAHAQKVMQEGRFRHLPVLDGDLLAGLLTERDVQLIASLDGADLRMLTASDAMTTTPWSVAPDASLDAVVSEMAENKYGSALVVDNGRVVGIFTAIDALEAFAELLHSRLAK
ncbi:MAG: CBS domain-containing protein [Polyangiales bacterium]